MFYEIYAGDKPYEVWACVERNVKTEKMSGHETFEEARAARKRYEQADARRGSAS